MKRALTCGLLPVLALCACSSESASSGIEEPIRVTNGQFFPGSFPAAHESGPAVSQVNISATEFPPGTVGKSITGDAEGSSQSVALALQGLGSGYWIVPIGAPDLLTAGDFTWSARCDFSHDLPSGFQNLLLSASDENGNFGPVSTRKLNIKSLLPKGQVVASLTWGVDADVDLHLVSPSGKELYSKRPNTIGSDSTGAPKSNSGLLDHDSLAGCIPDGQRTENVVWGDAPEDGAYTVRADLFSACGKPAVTFTFNLFVDGESVLERTGRLLDIDADGGGEGSGLFVTQFTCDEGTGTCL
ncbi:MAG: hypothetical protein ABIQ16_11480 [Polyangiaceae bacterium]